MLFPENSLSRYSLKDISFRYVCIFSFSSSSMSLMSRLEVCSQGTSFNYHYLKPHPCFAIFGYKKAEFKLKSFKEVWNCAWLPCSAVVAAISLIVLVGMLSKKQMPERHSSPKPKIDLHTVKKKKKTREKGRGEEKGNMLEFGCRKERADVLQDKGQRAQRNWRLVKTLWLSLNHFFPFSRVLRI